MAITKEVKIVVKETGIENVNKKVNELDSNIKKAENSTKELKKTSNDTTGGTVFSQIKKGAQDLIPALKGAESGFSSVAARMWDLVKNPVGLIIAGIVVSLKFLYEAFQSSVAGGKEIKQVFAGVAAVGDQVKDAVFGFGRAIINATTAVYKFLTLDFKGAAEDMKKANKEASTSYNQLTKAVDGTTFSLFRQLEARQQVNDKAKKMQAVTQSETNKLLVQSREILTDETASIRDKKKALEEVTKAEKLSSAEKVRIAKEDLNILKEKAKGLGGEAEKKMKGELRDATIALNESETENAMTGIKLNKQRKMLLREETAQQKELDDARKARQKELDDAEKERRKIAEENRQKDLKDLEDFKKLFTDNDKAIFDAKIQNELRAKEILAQLNPETPAQKLEREFQENMAVLEKANMSTINLQSKHIADLEAIDQDARDKRDAKDKEEVDKKIKLDEQVKNAKIDIANQTLSLISEIAGKGSKIGKAIAITQATISGVQGVQNAFTTASANPITAVFPAYPFIQAGLAGAFSAIQIAKIAKGDKAGGGGSAPSSSGGSAPQSPSFNLVQGTGRNQIAEGLQKQAPIKAYVVPTDVSTGQSMDRNIVKSASL